MILSEKETTVIKDLQTQEQCCVEKYERYSKLAKDQVLIDLFTDLHGKEQKPDTGAVWKSSFLRLQRQ